jgi:hypothetical protein
MSLLSMIQSVAKEIAITSPSSVIGNTDKQIIQLLQLAQTEGDELLSRHMWTAAQKEFTFTQSAAASQGAVATIIGSDFDYILNDILWNRTTQLPVLGPLAARDWQAIQAFPVTGPYPQYRINGGIMYFTPTPSNATDTIAGEYKSKNWCESSGGTDQDSWQDDTDVGLLDERLMRQGILWRWYHAKGLDYAEHFNTYERRVADAIARDGGRRTLRLDAGRSDRIPGIFVPQGSWNP